MNYKKILLILGRGIFPILAITATLYELIVENEWVDKVDDLVYLGVAISALLWGIFLKNKTPKYFPIIFLIIALATKLISLYIEGDDMKAVDPDYFILALIALSAIANGIQALNNKKSKYL